MSNDRKRLGRTVSDQAVNSQLHMETLLQCILAELQNISKKLDTPKPTTIIQQQSTNPYAFPPDMLPPGFANKKVHRIKNADDIFGGQDTEIEAATRSGLKTVINEKKSSTN